MAVRKPLVLVSGGIQEIPAGDTLSTGGGGGGGVTITDTYYDLTTETGIITRIDESITTRLVTDTTLGSTPLYSRTLTSGDMPSNAIIQESMVVLALGGFNNHTSSVSVSFLQSIDGAGNGSQLAVSVSASRYFNVGMIFGNVAALSSHDYGAFIWATVTGVIDVKYITMYLVPRTLFANNLAGFKFSMGGSHTVSNNLGIVTTANVNLVNITAQDTVIGQTYSASQGTPIPIGVAMRLGLLATNQNGGGTLTSATLYGVQVPRLLKSMVFS